MYYVEFIFYGFSFISGGMGLFFLHGLQGFSLDTLSGVNNSLQLMIRQKCDVDRCLLTLSFPTRLVFILLFICVLILLLSC
jgi:hypothetical protein